MSVTLVLGSFGYTLHYSRETAAYITRSKEGGLFCWLCRKRSCEHTRDLNEILYSEGGAA